MSSAKCNDLTQHLSLLHSGPPLDNLATNNPFSFSLDLIMNRKLGYLVVPIAVLMGAVAVLVVRYRLLFYPAVLFMLYAVVSVVGKAATRGGSVYDTGAQYIDALSPGLIMLGLWFMSYGRSSTTTTGENGEEEQKVVEWTWLFWLGESIVIALFSYNSITTIPWNVVSLSLLGVAGGLLALWFRGSFFNYLVVSCCHCAFSTMHRS
mmetsp:Transcript_7957/g.16585  ORF Transcript_7957/g.16585 Transcript_7957/m.16585 type:complete len:207 (-) Transcript_7957:2758-3378(-)